MGLRLTLGFLTISPSRVSPFNHIGTLPLQRKLPNHEYSFSALFCPVVLFLTGHAYLTHTVRKTFDTRTILVLHSFELVLTISSDTTLMGENNNTNNIPENVADIISPNLQESMRSNNQRAAIINHHKHK